MMMHGMSAFKHLLALALLTTMMRVSFAQQQWEAGVNDKGEKVQSLKIQAPSMTEEDQYGYNMPDRYRCDSCRAVVFHLDEALRRRQLKSRRLQEWELEEIFQDTCKTGFKGYGIKLIGGENVLSGPGLKAQEDLGPGMGAIQMGGEGWEKRLSEICRKFVYDKVGEDELYKAFLSSSALSENLCVETTRDCQVGPQQAKLDSTSETLTAKKKATAGAKKKARTTSVAKGAPVEPRFDFQSFIKALSVENGQLSSDYTGKHDRKHWERKLLQAADWVSKTQEKTAGVVTEV